MGYGVAVSTASCNIFPRDFRSTRDEKSKKGIKIGTAVGAEPLKKRAKIIEHETNESINNFETFFAKTIRFPFRQF